LALRTWSKLKSGNFPDDLRGLGPRTKFGRPDPAAADDPAATDPDPLICCTGAAPPPGTNPTSLPDIAHYRSHGIDRITAWCLTPFCCHQGMVTFDELAAQRSGGPVARSSSWAHGHTEQRFNAILVGFFESLWGEVVFVWSRAFRANNRTAVAPKY
jgi:hypothetical protein